MTHQHDDRKRNAVDRTAAVIGQLSDGRRFEVSSRSLTIGVDPRSIVIPLDEITAVHRGGRDIVITRREADPLTLAGVTLDDARSLEKALAERASSGEQRTHRRWHWRSDDRSPH